jgi:hypothetical protein
MPSSTLCVTKENKQELRITCHAYMQLRRPAAGRQDGAPLGACLVIRRRDGALPGAVRDVLPAVPHNAQRCSRNSSRSSSSSSPRPASPPLAGQVTAPPSSSTCHRYIRVHRFYIINMHACTDHVYTYVQVMRINLFSGVRFSLAWWACNVPDDERCLAMARGDQRAHPCAGRGAVRGGVHHHRRCAGDHHVPRVRAQGPVPRRVHRCHAASQGKFNKILTHFRASGDGVKDLVFAIPGKAPAADPTPSTPASRHRPWRVATAEQSRRPPSTSARF